jgi:hypothetical protein
MSYPPPNLSPRTDSSPAVPGSHAADHTAERNAINAIVAELGANPSLGYPTLQALLEAILTKIDLAQSPSDGSGSGSGDSGGSGGTGDSGNNVPGSGTNISLPAGTYPIDLSSISITPSSGGLAGRNFGKWFVGDLSAYGFYARTLVTEEEHDNHFWLTFINADATSTRQTFQLENILYGSPARAFVSIGGKLIQLVRSGRVWNATTHTFEDNGLLTSSDADTMSNYVARSDGYVWATFRAVWKLDSTGTISKVADVPSGYYTQHCVLSERGSWFMFRSDTLPDTNPQATKLALFSLSTNTFTDIANSVSSQVSVLFNGGDGDSPGAVVLQGGRLLGMTSTTNGVLRVLTTDMIETQTPTSLFSSGWTSQQTLPSPTGWLLAISKNGSQYQITAATDTDSFTLVAPTTEPIHNLHWRVDFEGLIVRWNQGTKLCEQSFSKLQELH